MREKLRHPRASLIGSLDCITFAYSTVCGAARGRAGGGRGRSGRNSGEDAVDNVQDTNYRSAQRVFAQAVIIFSRRSIEARVQSCSLLISLIILKLCLS